MRFECVYWTVLWRAQKVVDIFRVPAVSIRFIDEPHPDFQFRVAY